MELPMKVIESSDMEDFENDCNSLLRQGYRLVDASCGFVNDPKYDYCSSYQAVFVLPEYKK